jgi:hypothetical protein
MAATNQVVEGDRAFWGKPVVLNDAPKELCRFLNVPVLMGVPSHCSDRARMKVVFFHEEPP